MEQITSKIAIAALASLLLNAPFAIGEFLTRETSAPRAGFPLPLFIAMWLEMGVFSFLCLSVISALRNATWREEPILFAIQILVLGILAWAWVTLIIDQWPCFFLGGRGC